MPMLLPFILLIYAVPFLGLCVRFFKKVSFLYKKLPYKSFPEPLKKFILILCKIENLISFWRWVLLAVLGFKLLLKIYNTTFLINDPQTQWALAVFLGALALSWHQKNIKTRAELRLIEYLRVYPKIHPSDFFEAYHLECALGLGGLYAAGVPLSLKEDEVDFRKQKRSSLRFWPVLLGFIDTAIGLDLCFRALISIGPKYMFEMGDVVGSLVGKRLLQLSHASFKRVGFEKIGTLNGKCLFIFNHESALDFMLAPFALSQIKIRDRSARPRFFVAKDHFRNNPFIYHLLGFGKVIEALGMIFIDRKKREQSQKSLKEAARILIDNEIDLAIYPQGTRAKAVFDRAKKRRGAGYFTTISPRRLQEPFAHLKKGVGYLIYDILQELHAQNRDTDLHLIFVGIDGAAKVLPKSIWTIETESEIEFRLGEVQTLKPSLINEIHPQGLNSPQFEDERKEFVNDLLKWIDQRLIDVLKLPQKLSKRFLMDLKGQFRHFDDDKLNQITLALNEAYQNHEPVFPILDCIYSLPDKEWNGYLAQFCQILLMKPKANRFEDMQSLVRQAVVKVNKS